ncbi:hypothetical protein AVEN_1127-1 [Araneus ventricosus]|uniref:Integrase catalytic domain-containing protein n=1 Tax=Araneus ventricosus TaxID=182803 RepID=A0A4Y2G704_ARAVE|nr:hypothetical protein AVEN_1127-1 [Araneus ventricosus]
MPAFAHIHIDFTSILLLTESSVDHHYQIQMGKLFRPDMIETTARALKHENNPHVRLQQDSSVFHTHPPTNGIIERLHRHLKRFSRLYKMDRNATVLLGLRSALQENIKATCAQLVCHLTITLRSCDERSITKPLTYLCNQFNKTMRSLNPISLALHGTPKGLYQTLWLVLPCKI